MGQLLASNFMAFLDRFIFIGRIDTSSGNAFMYLLEKILQLKNPMFSKNDEFVNRKINITQQVINWEQELNMELTIREPLKDFSNTFNQWYKVKKFPM